MNNKAVVVSQLKQMKASLETQLDGVNAALTAFGVESKASNGRTRKASTGKTRGTPVAAIDAAAVKRGTATPEQIERHNKRLAEKEAAKAAKAEKSEPAKEYAGANLAQAAS